MKRLKFYVILTFTTILLMTTLTTAVPVHAAGESITIGAEMGTTGQQVTISGSGFDTSFLVQIMFGRNPGTNFSSTTDRYELVGTASVIANGTFSTSFGVPTLLSGGSMETVTGGTYYVYCVYQGTSVVLDSVSFTVLGGDLMLSQAIGAPGTQVLLVGSGFNPNESLTVQFDNELIAPMGNAPADSAGNLANIPILIPSDCTAGPHGLRVTGTTSNHQVGTVFTVEPGIQFRPDPGTASTSIQMSAKGFAANSAVTILFDNTQVYSGTTNDKGTLLGSGGQVTHTFPANTLTQGDFIVTATDGSGNSVQRQFSIFDSSLILNPVAGSPGFDVNISGEGFKSSSTVTVSFEGIPSSKNVTASTDADGKFSTVFFAPWGEMGTWNVEVTDGENTKTIPFEVNTSSLILPLTNMTNAGYVNQQISIAGTGFTAGRTILVVYDQTQVASTTAAGDGTFTNVIFNAPASAAGLHTIRAYDSADPNTYIDYAFVMEGTAPPQVTTTLPEANSKASAETFFDWEDIATADEPSGVTYTLQIASDQNFTSIVREETGLTISEFTMPNKLNAASEDAPYYWRVRAVDLASNEGAWSNVSSFFIGFGFSMPQWVIYVIIVVAALALSIFTFWLGRKTAYY
jgi:hypothetical protein